ncbi:sulfatase [bacterium]|nr:sulfatase [bacterium]
MDPIGRRDFLRLSLAGAAAAALIGCRPKHTATPNVVFFLIDDMGWTDLACYGSRYYETPHIDRLAREGMRFTDAYAACPVCSPTRASILSGKYPARVGITDWIPGDDPKNRKLLGAEDRHELPLDEVTLAEAFHGAGYATGFFGKWHLGGKGFYPEDQGFDVNVAGHWAGHPASYFYPYKNTQERWDVPGLEGGETGEYLTDRLTDESLAFIEANRDQPFMLYLSHYAVHTPVQSKMDLMEKYRKKLGGMAPQEGAETVTEGPSRAKQKQDNPAYAGMVESVDESVGRIADKLEELGLTERTVIVFMSDNGGLSTVRGNWNPPTSNVLLRAGKGWLYEGGIREPMIVKWPGVTEPGSVCAEPVISTDFYPTLLEAAGLPLRPHQHEDGVSLVPLLKQRAGLKREALYWHYPHYHSSGMTPGGAMRAGDYKLIEWFETGEVELYNLKDDVSEKHDLAADMPAKAQELLGMLRSWRKETGAKMPAVNPAYTEPRM